MSFDATFYIFLKSLVGLPSERAVDQLTDQNDVFLQFAVRFGVAVAEPSH